MQFEKKINARRGSALLIVLGMLSFMVVSAVGFSIYMRQSRAPSSYLTRNVTARHLVKAALANAIEDLDSGFMSQYDIGIASKNDPDNGYLYGIYDDPYPGVGVQSSESVNEQTHTQTGTQMNFTKNGNFWFKRVFCPFGLLGYPQNVSKAVDEPVETVPTLTLEALAYLPPAIIDDVRKISRQTRTAQWKSLPYESGRYAFTAVNVSDLFDINRLRASVPRNSGRDRITLATLTSNDPADPTAVDEGRADTLDRILEKMENNKIGGQIVPFTSLADFNLSAIGSAYAPLMQYIGTSAAQLPQTAEAANGMFVTDTWFPSTNGVGSTCIDLGGVDGPGQPFKSNKYMANSFVEVLGMVTSDNNIKQILEGNLGIGLVCLYDYLDSDSVPISLALPTTEAVPMVVGVSAPAGLQPTFGNIGGPVSAPNFSVPGTGTDVNGNTTQIPAIPVTRTLQQKGITSFGNNVVIQCLACYPFKRMVTSKRKTANDFRARGILRIWMAPSSMGCRPSHDANLRPFADDINNINGKGLSKNGVATFVSADFTAGEQINAFQQDVTKTDDAVKPFRLTFRDLNIEMPVYWEVTETAGEVAGYFNVVPDAKQFKSSYKTLYWSGTMLDWLRPLVADGSFNLEWEDAVKKAPSKLNEPYGTGLREMVAVEKEKFRIYAALWIQILDVTGKVVDMVPACLADDNEWLARNVPDNGTTQRMCGDGAPLLNFRTDTDIVFDDKIDQALSQSITFNDWNCLYAVDPRYNWAPEDWFAMSSGLANENDWKSKLGLTGSSSPLLGKDGRDRDIFMFVSDQEYLQSIGELQFLPMVSVMDGVDKFMDGDFSPNYHRKSFADRLNPDLTKAENFANGGRFWRTYTAYNNGDVAAVDELNPYKMRYQGNVVTFNSSAGTFKINPYTDDDRILSAAFVGTPYDYYVASTNAEQRQVGGKKNQLLLVDELDIKTMKSTYGWGTAPLAKLEGEELLNVMDSFRESVANAVKGGAVKSWESIWNDLQWQDIGDAKINEFNDSFLGATHAYDMMSFLHGVDRKYLYSFWRDCFDNSQQLFLIFVRAEPSTVGGGAAGRVSAAQLGGRAVALVWRDPSVPAGITGGERKSRQSIMNRDTYREMKSKCPPHRTRVLFYHQFD